MTTYTDPSTLNTDPNDPVTSVLLTAVKDNPVAIAEGASGAPRVVAGALGTYLGTGSATAAGAILDVTDLADVGQVLVYGLLEVDAPADESATVKVQVAYSTDNGSTFGSASDVPGASLTSGGSPETGQFIYVVALTGGQNALRFSLQEIGDLSTLSGTITAIGLARK
jgi:hypothetical protein